jgi:hypothetical protein
MNNDFNNQNDGYNKKRKNEKIEVEKIKKKIDNFYFDSASNWIISRDKNPYMWNSMIRFFALGTYMYLYIHVSLCLYVCTYIYLIIQLYQYKHRCIYLISFICNV